MRTNCRLLLCCFLVVPGFGHADSFDQAVEAVNCINRMNGHPKDLSNVPPELTQVELDNVAGDGFRYVDGHFLLLSREIQGLRTWAAILNLNEGQRIAFDVREAAEAEADAPPELFVPAEVVTAFGKCGIRWNGYKPSDYRLLIQTESSRAPSTGPDPDLSFEGNSLLPPLE